MKAFETPNSNVVSWGSDYITGIISMDEPSTINAMKKFLDNKAMKVQNPVIKNVKIDECVF